MKTYIIVILVAGLLVSPVYACDENAYLKGHNAGEDLAVKRATLNLVTLLNMAYGRDKAGEIIDKMDEQRKIFHSYKKEALRKQKIDPVRKRTGKSDIEI